MQGGGLKVLMISGDRNILVPGSAVATRMQEYGALVEELHIIVMADAAHGLKETKLGNNVWVYPTSASVSFLRPLSAARLGKKLVLEKKFVRGQSLITADSIEAGWAGMSIKYRWRLPLEVQLHTNIFSSFFSGFQNKVRQFFAGSVLSSADGVRVVSEELKARISPLTQASVTVLPIYVDPTPIENAPITFDLHARYGWQFVLLMVCRLAPEKNIPLALETLVLVRQQFPDTGLVIVGSGSEEVALRAKARKLGLNGFVEFAGWQTELASFYKTANVFLQTSYFEGYGLALVEAGLSGLPVVTTPVGLARELESGKDAYVLEPQAALFAAVIVDLLEHNQKRENLRFNLKQTLDMKLVSQEAYLSQLKTTWENTSRHISL
jgi:glycosyltransferase involved in cell wall biosynthesis